MNENEISYKPKLVFFRPPKNVLSANTIHPLIDRIEMALSFQFDLVSISESCDYDRVLEKHQPDLAIFQLLEGHFDSYKINGVNNTIPKLAWMPIDIMSPSRGIFYRYLEKYSVDAYFSASIHMGEFFPELKDMLYYCPDFIDAEINRDYELTKNIPILMTGNFEGKDSEYEWRANVKKSIIDNFPALYYRHPGYGFSSSPIPEILRIHGEKYFKILNSSWIAPTCGSFLKTILMKHLEIPAARCCLITEENEVLKRFGFKNMENCVFSSPKEIVDKLNYLFHNQEILENITNKGFMHVHKYHTHRNRNQFIEWYKLNNSKNFNQRIIQPSIFAKLELADLTSSGQTEHLSVGSFSESIRSIDRKLSLGIFSKTVERDCQELLRFVKYLSDPKLRLVLISLAKGQYNKAFLYLSEIFRFECRFGKNVIPDSINMSLFIIFLLCTNKKSLALKYSKTLISSTRRKELDYVRLVCFKLTGEINLFNLLRSEIVQKERQDYKTMYFFAKEFNLIEFYEKILYKRFGRKQFNTEFTYNYLLKEEKVCENIELKNHDLQYSSKDLLIDLEFSRPYFFLNLKKKKILNKIKQLVIRGFVL